MIVRELLTLLGFDLDEKGAAQYERRTEQTQRKVERATTAIGRAWEKASRAADAGLARMDRGLERVQNGAQGVADNLGGVASMLMGGLGFAHFANVTSQFTDLHSRLKAATEGTVESADKLLDGLNDVALRTYQDTQQVVDGFLQMKPGLDQLGLSMDDQVNVLQSMNDAMTVGGIKGDKAALAMMWLSRSFSAGKMSLEAFNGVFEAGDDLVVQWSKNTGKSIEELRSMAKAGKLTSRWLADHYLYTMEQMRALSEEMPVTINDSIKRVTSTMGFWIYRMDKAYGVSKKIADMFLWLADHPYLSGGVFLAGMGVALVGATAQLIAYGAAALRVIPATIAWLKALTLAQLRAAATNPFAWAVVGILALRDFIGWANGADSALGKFIGRFDELVAKGARARSLLPDFLVRMAQSTNAAAKGLSDLVAAWNAFWSKPITLPDFGKFIKDALAALWGDGLEFDFAGSPLDKMLKATGIDAAALWDRLSTEAGAAWETIKTKLVGELTGGIENVKASWTGMVDGVQNAFGSAVDWMIAKWGEFKSALSDNALVRGAKGLANKAAEAMGFDAPFAGTVSPQMPAHADGTRSAGRGLALVGEEGPEIVRFGGGEQVIPAAPSSRMLEALAANARGFAQRAADFGERFAADFGGMQGRLAAPGLAAGMVPSPATRLQPVGGTSAATINVGGIKVEVTAAEAAGMNPQALGDLVAKRVKGEMAGVAEGVFAKEIRRATRHFTEQE